MSAAIQAGFKAGNPAAELELFVSRAMRAYL
jgi:hypothetical protein